jgi:Holliday junction resolvasome RuvABC endonuclease subunit
MIYVALDLSINSSGVCIADTEARTCEFVRLTPKAYEKSPIAGRKYVKMLHNAMQISDAMLKLLLPYRFQPMHVVIESVGFGYMHAHTNSFTDLLFEGAVVSSKLVENLACGVDFIEPKTHKKAFTGKGNANKELSVRQLLHWFPQLYRCTDKFDDLADAMSLMTVVVHDIHEYAPTIRNW